MATKPQTNAVAAAGTAHLYNEQYFQGGQTKSNYSDYLSQALGPSKILAETLFEFFRPATALDAGCAVGHAVKRLRELGSLAYGCDISDWAVKNANVAYVKKKDFSQDPIRLQFDLVYSYDVIEHILPENLEFAAKNLWNATKKDLLMVPAVYNNGETSDPNEPTHLIFKPKAWWIEFFVSKAGCWYDEEASNRFSKLYHSSEFNYSNRIMIFSRLKPGRTDSTDF